MSWHQISFGFCQLGKKQQKKIRKRSNHKHYSKNKQKQKVTVFFFFSRPTAFHLGICFQKIISGLWREGEKNQPNPMTATFFQESTFLFSEWMPPNLPLSLLSGLLSLQWFSIWTCFLTQNLLRISSPTPEEFHKLPAPPYVLGSVSFRMVFPENGKEKMCVHVHVCEYLGMLSSVLHFKSIELSFNKWQAILNFTPLYWRI